MLNLISSDSGKTNILGKDVNELSSKEISHISYLPGEFEMYSNLTGKQYLTYISNLRNAKTNNIHLLSDQLDLDLNKKINALSKGNKQKIGIVQAFMNSPKLAILDEPTRGIDIGSKQEIYKLMEDLAASGVAVIFVSSEMEEVLGMADRALVMHEGRIAGELARNELSEQAIMQLATGTPLAA